MGRRITEKMTSFYYNTIIYKMVHNTVILGIQCSNTNPTSSATFLSLMFWTHHPSLPFSEAQTIDFKVLVTTKRKIALSKDRSIKVNLWSCYISQWLIEVIVWGLMVGASWSYSVIILPIKLHNFPIKFVVLLLVYQFYEIWRCHVLQELRGWNYLGARGLMRFTCGVEPFPYLVLGCEWWLISLQVKKGGGEI